MFGNKGVSQGGSLFGGLNPTNPTTTSGGLFGSVGATSQPQQQQTGGSSFSGFGLGTSTQPQQQQQTTGTSGLGAFGATTQPQQQAAANTFGSTSQPAPQSSLFASTISQNQQNGGTSTYFDTILEKSRKRALGEIADENFPQLQLGLGDLRQRIKKFAPGPSDKATDSRAHYLLAASGVDPGAAVRDLNLLSSTAGRVDRPQPQEALETDVDGYLANLQTQTTLNMISDGLARSIRDFDTFLEDNVTMEWDAQRKRIYQHFGIKQRETKAIGGRSGFSTPESQGGFGRSRRSKAAALAGSRTSGDAGGSTFGKSGLQKSVIGAAAPLGSNFQPAFTDIEKRMEANGIAAPDPHDRFYRERQGRLAEKIQKLNEARLEKRCLPILHELRNTVREGGEEHSSSICKAYGAIIKIVDEIGDTLPPSDPLAVRERQFATAYLDEDQTTTQSTEIRKRIILGSSRFLEAQFFEDVEAFIAKNPREANLGGVPDVLSKVKAYVRLRAVRKDLVPDNIGLQVIQNGDYVWALVFYLLRTGHVREAVNYVTENAVAFRAIDRNFASYITDYHNSPEKRLRRELQERINSEYNQRLRIAPENSIDPYRMACYKVIGRCDLKNRTLDDSLKPTMEDYMWLQFILAREASRTEESASESCNLSTVQNVIREAGPRHFAKGEHWATYFYVQILGGLFEEAVAHLYPHSYPDAVHIAIALDYYGLLRVSDPDALGESSLLTFTTRGLPQIKFGHMLGYYTRDFRAASVTAAVDYLTLICLNRDLPHNLGRKQVNLCHEALRELVLESREFALLLGDMRGDGQRIQGIIEVRMRLIAEQETDTFMRTITIQAASVADDNGRVTDAVLLYHLAGEYDNVVVIVTQAISEAVSVQIGQEQMRLQPLKPRATSVNQRNPVDSLSLTSIDDPIELGNRMMKLYKNHQYSSRIKQSNLAACETILQIAEVKAHVEKEQWLQALNGIQALNILPIRVKGDAATIRSCATIFSSLPQPVANTIPNLLLWAIMCTSKEIAYHSGSEFSANAGYNVGLVHDLRQQTMDLTTYTSMLRYRFPTYLNEALARAQSE